MRIKNEVYSIHIDAHTPFLFQIEQYKEFVGENSLKPGEGNVAAMKLVDEFFTRQFFVHVVWAGIKRTKNNDSSRIKPAFKQFRNILNFFHELVKTSARDFSFTDTEKFFQCNAIQHAVRRAENKPLRASRPKIRLTKKQNVVQSLQSVVGEGNRFSGTFNAHETAARPNVDTVREKNMTTSLSKESVQLFDAEPSENCATLVTTSPPENSDALLAATPTFTAATPMPTFTSSFGISCLDEIPEEIFTIETMTDVEIVTENVTDDVTTAENNDGANDCKESLLSSQSDIESNESDGCESDDESMEDEDDDKAKLEVSWLILRYSKNTIIVCV